MMATDTFRGLILLFSRAIIFIYDRVVPFFGSTLVDEHIAFHSCTLGAWQGSCRVSLLPTEPSKPCPEGTEACLHSFFHLRFSTFLVSISPCDYSTIVCLCTYLRFSCSTASPIASCVHYVCTVCRCYRQHLCLFPTVLDLTLRRSFKKRRLILTSGTVA